MSDQLSARSQQPGQGAHRFSDAHAVVVEDEQQLALLRAGVLHGLVDHARAQSAIADHGDAAVWPVAQPVAHSQAHRHRCRHAGVGAGEQVVLALPRRRITAQSPLGPQSVEAVGPPGEQLVGVDLMADVPDEAVAREVENVMQGDGQLHHPRGPPKWPPFRDMVSMI
jgi:hypothetical protein